MKIPVYVLQKTLLLFIYRADLYSLMTCLVVWRISKGWAAFTMLSSICSLLLHSLPLCSAVGGVRKAKHTAFLLSHLGEQK